MAATAVFSLVLHLIWTGFPVVAIFCAPIGGAIGVYSTLTLKLGESGVEIAGRTAGWPDVILNQSMWGHSLRTRPGGAGQRQRVNAFLPMYELSWRHGQIGHVLETWAPQLLEATLDDV